MSRWDRLAELLELEWFEQAAEQTAAQGARLMSRIWLARFWNSGAGRRPVEQRQPVSGRLRPFA
ncbi:MAG: hypothetical protein KIS89_02045 [Dokdonella sp.]|nr:hypothetical protein [Dokdonella sp.]